jgi:signal transduction histidine kinase
MSKKARFPELVSRACYDLRSPLAAVHGFASALKGADGFDGDVRRYLAMIEEASEEMQALVDQLAVAARIERGSWQPPLRELNTMRLARSEDERIQIEGSGSPVEVEPRSVSQALSSLARAALHHGPVESVTWSVDGRNLKLSPVTESAAPVVSGETARDLGSLVARMVIECSGGTLWLDGRTLRVAF